MPLYSAEAINLRSRNFGEADKVITLFAKKYGKIQAIAKGARRPTSKFGGRLEIFTYNQLLLATAKNLDIISQCETIESFFRLRDDNDKLNAGFYIVKLIDIMTEDRQRNDELFSLLLDSLFALQGGAKTDILVRAFEVKLCEVEGFLPSDEMLELKYKRLPYIAGKLKASFEADAGDLTAKDLEVTGKIFRELISDHTGFDIRKFRVAI
jgi:DNA repair protein RecO (recombination protein O)